MLSCSSICYSTHLTLKAHAIWRLPNVGFRDYIVEKATEKAVELTTVVAVEALRAPAAALGTALEKAGNAVDNAMESRAAKLDAEYIAKRPHNKRLIIRLLAGEGGISVEVAEMDGRVLYTGKGKLSKMAVSLKVKTKAGRLYGTIKKSMIATRNPLIHEDHPADFNIEFDGVNKMTVKTVNDSLYDYEITPYGWHAGYSSDGHAVSNGDGALFYYESRPWHTTTTYMVDFKQNMKIEGQAVLITLAIMLHSKWSVLV